MELTVHADADNINSDRIALDMEPVKLQSLAPNLERIAVVSSPVVTDTIDKDGKPELADEKLNAALREALAQVKEVKEKAAVYGWHED